MEYVFIGIFCIIATAFFAVTVGASKKNSAISGVLGGIGYITYLLLNKHSAEATAVFVATFIICLMSEILARVMKTPTTVFSIPAILPLVPGLMLYKTLLVFGSGDTLNGVSKSIDTLIVAGSLSLAVTLAALLAKLIFKRKHKA